MPSDRTDGRTARGRCQAVVGLGGLQAGNKSRSGVDRTAMVLDLKAVGRALERIVLSDDAGVRPCARVIVTAGGTPWPVTKVKLVRVDSLV